MQGVREHRLRVRSISCSVTQVKLRLKKGALLKKIETKSIYKITNLSCFLYLLIKFYISNYLKYFLNKIIDLIYILSYSTQKLPILITIKMILKSKIYSIKNYLINYLFYFILFISQCIQT